MCSPCHLVAAALALPLFVLSAYADELPHHEFDFHRYDDLSSKQAKEVAALHDLTIDFPPGSPMDRLKALLSERGTASFCQKRTYIPPTDRAALTGNHVYYELNYRDPNDPGGLVAVKWGVDIRYGDNKQLIEEIRVHWSRAFIGG
jgi:hypothetical protein